ncbi:MAG: hypothetical protein JRG74_13545 [Deltaproteobacteria bacterium]|nr:hypothetical protein [Deltaproteobacteria bacterium]
MGKKKNPFVSKQQANNFPFAGRRITFSQFRPETEKVTINPENPACPVGAKHRTGVKNKPLAEKTIEEVLLQFGDKLNKGLIRGVGLNYRVVDCSEVQVETKELYWGERRKKGNYMMKEFWVVGILSAQYFNNPKNFLKGNTDQRKRSMI